MYGGCTPAIPPKKLHGSPTTTLCAILSCTFARIGNGAKQWLLTGTPKSRQVRLVEVSIVPKQSRNNNCPKESSPRTRELRLPKQSFRIPRRNRGIPSPLSQAHRAYAINHKACDTRCFPLVMHSGLTRCLASSIRPTACRRASVV